jgi:DNA-binding beta-propeller fold protein YncE
MPTPMLRRLLAFLATFMLVISVLAATEGKPAHGRYLYVAVPGIRNYLEYGGHGVLVYDIDAGHKLVRRIPAGGLAPNGKPSNVKGICASAATGRLYVSTIHSLQCFDLLTDKLLWDKAYEAGCDRMSITPDGKTIYLPSFEKDHWLVVNALDGSEIKKLILNSRAHNTIISADGREAYMAGLGSSFLAVADTATHTLKRAVGPFSAPIRPFTVNGRLTKIYANVNDLLGFEIGDLQTGRLLQRVEVTGFAKGPVKRHGCPSHGIALSPDEKELWLADGHNSQVHIFDLSGGMIRQKQSLPVRDQPGWITFSLDGKTVYPSTGEVFDAATKQIIATLQDETGKPVHSEKLLEIDFENGKPVRAGNQFALGAVQ